MWVARYEKEQQEHTLTNSQLLQSKSDLKDQILATKNAEIKLQTITRQIDMYQDQNKKLQDSVNENQAKTENIERELNTQKEIQKNLERSKQERIEKLKNDLETVEERYKGMIN